MVEDLKTVLKTLFGFESDREWKDEEGVVENFPVRRLIEVGRENGMMFRGLIYCYRISDGKRSVDVRVVEMSNRKLSLEFEYDGRKFKFIERV